MRRTVEMRGRCWTKDFGPREAKPIHPLTEDQRLLVEQNKALAHRYANSHRVPFGMDKEDWHSECLLQLVRAATTYDPARGAFSTWAWVYMDLILPHWAAYWSAECRAKVRTKTLGDVTVRGLADAESNAVGGMIWDDVQKQYEKLMSALPADWREVVRQVVAEEKTFRAIGAERGVSRQAIEQQYKRALDYLGSFVRQQGMECAL